MCSGLLVVIMYIMAQEKLIITSSTSSGTQAMLCKYLTIRVFNIYLKCSQSENKHGYAT